LLTNNVTLRRVYVMSHGAGLADAPLDWYVQFSPNRGRESHNYLLWLSQHALDKDVADIVWFCQARIDGYMQSKLWPRLPQINARTGFIGLSIIEKATCDAGSYPGLSPLIIQIYAMVNQDYCHGHWVAAYNGAFAVSRRRIRAHTPHLYRNLANALQANLSETHLHVDQMPGGHPGRPSSVVDPSLGYALERSWNLIFKCKEFAVNFCCESETAPNPEKCRVSDCQCFDD